MPGAHALGPQVYCVAEAFERELVEKRLQELHPHATWSMYPDAIYFKSPFCASGSGHGEVFILDGS